MGTAGFIMAEFLNIPYIQVCKALIIPALLYYVSCFMGVHYEAVKLDLKPIPKDQIPLSKNVIKFDKLFLLFFPIATLIYTLIKGFSLTFVGSLACITLLMIYLIREIFYVRKNYFNIAKEIINIFITSGETIVKLVPILVCANIVLCLFDYTGLGIKLAYIVMDLGQSNLIISLILIALLVMILGTGLPITAAYILGVIVAIPLLTNLGVKGIAAHVFILFYSILATITPPMCPAIFLAASMAKANWLKAAFYALRLAPVLYIIPFIAIFDNTLLLIGNPFAIILNVGTAIIGSIIFNSGTIGYFVKNNTLIETILLIVSGLLLLLPGFSLDILGGVIVLIIFIKQKKGNLKINQLSIY